MGAKYGKPTPLVHALGAAASAEAELGDCFGTDAQIKICGSVRRGKPVVTDVDIVVVLPRIGEIAFLDWTWPDGWHVTPKQATKDVDGVRVECYWSPVESMGPGLVFLTGPMTLNVFMRRQAQKRGWQLNQYGLWAGETRMDEFTEESVFEMLGLPYMEPKDREHWADVIGDVRYR